MMKIDQSDERQMSSFELHIVDARSEGAGGGSAREQLGL
jgi:hypothetical protein